MDEVFKFLLDRGDVVFLLSAFILALSRGVIRWGFTVQRELNLMQEIIDVHRSRAEALAKELHDAGVERARANNELLEALKDAAERRRVGR